MFTFNYLQLVMGADNGRYVCTAENSAGTAESTIVVAIRKFLVFHFLQWRVFLLFSLRSWLTKCWQYCSSELNNIVECTDTMTTWGSIFRDLNYLILGQLCNSLNLPKGHKSIRPSQKGFKSKSLTVFAESLVKLIIL